MGFITIQAITFAESPDSPINVTISYRLTSDPDTPASYTVLPGTYEVQTTGDIVPDVTISGLLDSTSYTVKIETECAGSATQVFTTS